MTLNYLDFRFIYINYVSPKFADLVEVSKNIIFGILQFLQKLHRISFCLKQRYSSRKEIETGTKPKKKQKIELKYSVS